ncbi:MAG: hypothetical protein JOY99_04685 [Sphingomonadaceae bacterium]|nr:hypothetical protein [Sphingomonadaceae bacterium]
MLVGGAAYAQSIVVRSIGPSAKLYPPGRSIADNATLTLAANDQITLLDGRGTRTLKGPGAFSLAAAGQAGDSAGTRFAALVDARSTQRARVGAVRGMSAGPRHSPNIWYVDTSRSGAVCVADPSALTLWRADASSAGTMTVKGGGQTATVSFGAGQSSAAWPSTLPVVAGAQYTLGWAGSPQANSIRFALLGDGAQGIENTASALIRNGCDTQLDLLVNVMSLPETGGGPQG